QESDKAQQLWRDSRQKPPQTAARPRNPRGLAEACSLFGPRTSRARHRPTPARGANQQRLRAASRASWPPPSLAPTGKKTSHPLADGLPLLPRGRPRLGDIEVTIG